MDYYFVVYGLTFISLIITLLAQFFVSSSYSKYKKVKNERNLTGKEAARYLLDKHNLNDIKVVETSGYLTDHYDPSKRVIRLSSDVYRGTSIASVSVACHECGHAIQDKENYLFLRIRSKLVPLVNFSSYAGYVAIVLGCLFGSLNLIWVGIIAELVILLFQLITLPVEIDASKRAMKELDYSHFFNSEELKQGKTMLIAAALTYVASVVTTLIQILRLILMFGRRED
ncbi:MAG: zinc metallopeptidase [Bacilli bacterium]